MKKILFAFLTGIFCAVFAFTTFGAEEKSFKIVENGESDLFVSSRLSWKDKDINKDLVQSIIDAVKAKTGVELKESIADMQLKDREIVIGYIKGTNNTAKKRAAADPGVYELDVDLVGPLGWAIFTYENRIVILTPDSDMSAANSEAVYYFISEGLGYDPFAEETESVSNLSIKPINKVKSHYLDIDSLVGVTANGVDIGEYTIVYPAGASKTVVDLAENLRRVIFALSGRIVALVDDSQPAAAHEILVGNTNRADAAKAYSVLKTDGTNIIVSGATDEGVVAAMELLYRQYFSIIGTTYIGNGEDIALGNISHEGDVFRSVNELPEYTTFFRHTVASLLGTDKTPCFSDSATADKLISAIKATNPVNGSTVYLVNNTGSYCSCAGCGGKSEAFFSTVNTVAKALSGDNITVATLAYRETLTAPSFALESNVLVYFAAPDMCLGHTLGDGSCETNKAIKTALESWKNKARVYVLDFSQDYRYYPSTLPNFDIINANYKLYTENANGVMYVWCKFGAVLEYGELRYSIINRVISSNLSEEEFSAAKKEIIADLYGQDAEAMEKYIALFTEKALDHFTIFTKPQEMLPIAKTENGEYDLTIAKELYAIWKGAYRRHDAPADGITSIEEVFFKYDYITSDYYQTLHSRVQFTEWLRWNIDRLDMFYVSKELAGVK
ncbi:MAG: DUF4838 domain-containing protein [Clostridia bacterium]|nr:DUF4838 domain-containing protein [Clostridia bacterium]